MYFTEACLQVLDGLLQQEAPVLHERHVGGEALDLRELVRGNEDGGIASLLQETVHYFVAHQDGNTPLLHDDTRFRRISVVLFLSEPESYGGGALLFHGRYPDFDTRHEVAAAPGTLVAFRSETTHEVTPVTRGERFTIVSWWRG